MWVFSIREVRLSVINHKYVDYVVSMPTFFFIFIFLERENDVCVYRVHVISVGTAVDSMGCGDYVAHL